MVILTVLGELLEHEISGDCLLHHVSVDVRGKNELISRKMSQQLLGNVTSLRDTPAVLEDLHEYNELEGALQEDGLIKGHPELILSVLRQAEKETNYASLGLVRVAAEKKLHRVRLQESLQE